jgi:hypothetical protein
VRDMNCSRCSFALWSTMYLVCKFKCPRMKYAFGYSCLHASFGLRATRKKLRSEWSTEGHGAVVKSWRSKVSPFTLTAHAATFPSKHVQVDANRQHNCGEYGIGKRDVPGCRERNKAGLIRVTEEVELWQWLARSPGFEGPALAVTTI